MKKKGSLEKKKVLKGLKGSTGKPALFMKVVIPYCYVVTFYCAYLNVLYMISCLHVNCISQLTNLVYIIKSSCLSSTINCSKPPTCPFQRVSKIKRLGTWTKNFINPFPSSIHDLFHIFTDSVLPFIEIRVIWEWFCC